MTLKKITLLMGFLLAFYAQAQNIIYFEVTSGLADFSTGQGVVEVHQTGVHPDAEVFVSYNRLVGGNLTPTGWISLTGTTLSDVAGEYMEAKVEYMETEISGGYHSFDVNYTVFSVNTTGFDADGVWQGGNWSIEINFTGPDTNCDAFYFGDQFLFAVNNVMTITGSAALQGYEMVDFNGGMSSMSLYFLDEAGFEPIYPTGTLLNAYIPRVQNRPATETACDGVINFERVSMVSDVELQYAINGGSFQTLVSDQFTNVCANDRIHIIGTSPTVMAGDTLLETYYVLKSALNQEAVDLDLSHAQLVLNESQPGDNTSNKITVSSVDGSDGYGFIFNEKEEYFDVWIESNPYHYLSQPQGKYRFHTPDAFYSGYLTNFFTFVILDENNVYHNPFREYEIIQENPDTNDCNTHVRITDTSSASDAFIARSDFQIVDIGMFSEFQQNFPFVGNYSSDTAMLGFCPGLYAFQYENQTPKVQIITDSLQRISATYSYMTSLYDDNFENGNFHLVPDVDTVFHYWSECTNDYFSPFSTAEYDTNMLINTIWFSNGVTFEKYECRFILTQNGNTITLPMREVLAEVPESVGEFPYYIVAELYCNDGLKSTQKRRRIIVSPDGEIQDIYGEALGLENQALVSNVFYPNPVTDRLNILSSGMRTSIRILDLQGKCLLEKAYDGKEKEYQMDVHFLTNGSYILEVSEGNKFKREKFVKL